MNRRAQSAMEYLMTYGWAILVVLIALSALFYLGVFDPDVKNSCTATAPVTCTDVKVFSGIYTGSNYDYITLNLAVAGGSGTVTGISTFTINGASISGFNCPAPSPTTISSTPTEKRWGCLHTTSTKFTKGGKFEGTTVVTYTPLYGIAHTQTVTFIGTVE